MGYWSIVLPEATTNYATNPSCEAGGIGGWAAYGGGASVNLSFVARRGLYAVKIDSASSADTGGQYSEAMTVTSGYSISFDIYSDATSVKIEVLDGAVSRYSQTVTLTAGVWTRLEVTNVTLTGGNTAYLRILTPTASARTYYVDGLQIEAKAYCTSYCDGNLGDGYRWNGVEYASSSTRSAQARNGGRVYVLDTQGIYCSLSSGIGMPPVEQTLQEQSLLPGALYQDTRTQVRVLTLSLWAEGSSRANLHSLRKWLINAVKPDLTGGPKPFILRYSGAGITLELNCVYDGGLEFGEITNRWLEKFALRLIATDPFWREDGNLVSTALGLHPYLAVSNANGILGRIDGTWTALGTGVAGGATADVYALAVAPNGILYVGGDFTTANGVTVNYVASWNGTTFAALGAGVGLNNIVRALAVDPAGYLYAGGDFTATNGGGTTLNYVGKWNGSTWAAMGSPAGFNGRVQALAIAPDGTIYAGGQFTTTNGGGTTLNYVAKWSGSAWVALGSPAGFSAQVSTLTVAPDGTLYAGGAFATTNGGGTTLNSIARWTGSAWVALSTGMSGGTPWVYALVIDSAGRLYAVGDMTSAGGVSVNYIARWNGAAWAALGTGLAGGTAWALTIDADGHLWVGGDFTSAGGITTADRLAMWNGSAWVHVDVDLPGTPVVYALATRREDIYTGFSTAGEASAAYTVAMQPTGSTAIYPKFRLTGPGTLQWLENQSTGDRLYFNLYIQSNEKVWIDLTPGEKRIYSTWRGNLYHKLLAGSHLGTFRLLPASNTLALYISGSSGSTSCYFIYTPTYWSVDGVAP